MPKYAQAKHAKDLQARRIRRILFNPRANQPQLAQGQSHLMNGNIPRDSSALDSRSIDELMKYIEGREDLSKTPASRKKASRGNPRRRGGVSVGAGV